MAEKGLWEPGSSGKLGVGEPRTPKLPRAPRKRDPALIIVINITTTITNPYSTSSSSSSSPTSSNRDHPSGGKRL